MTPPARSSVAAVLFTDLVGSTERMTHLGDTAFDALRNEHLTRMARAVDAHHGTVVKNTGDGVLATFTSAVDALAAATAAQQATASQAATGAVAFTIRVGLAIGEVAFEGEDVFGTPVVEAARLLAAARPAQILCTTLVRAMAGSRALVAFTDVGALDLKGLAEPVPACEVAWELLAEPVAVPLPGLLSRTGRIFVGRDEDLVSLRQQWKEVQAGERRVSLLGGEPGVGKTRLAAELAGGLHADGALVLAGRCDEDLGVPYQPFVEALRHYVTHVPAPRLGRHGGELARLVPELAQVVPGLPEPISSDPETERYRLFDAVAGWLADVSAETPALLVLDDLHWAAKPTVLLLRHVLRFSEALRLLVVATYRDTDIGRGHPLSELLADVRRFEGAERLPVSGLDAPSVAVFFERAAGHALDEAGTELARVVWRETEGNPLFVTEMLRHLTESGALERHADRWVVTSVLEELGIPEGVRDVVGRRLSRLSEETNRVLACAAVVGLEFDPAVVQAAGEFSEDGVLTALEAAGSTRLVLEVPGPVPRNRFSHALIRATLYDELTAARRVALHRKVAEAIEAVYGQLLDDHLPSLAHHWARASAPAADTARAVEYASRAGDRALVQLAHDEAGAYYRSALELLDASSGPADPRQRLDLLISLGDAQRRSGDPAHRQLLLDAARQAREQGADEALARAALANSRGMFSISERVDAERVAVLEAALEVTGSRDSALRARLLSDLASELVFSLENDRRRDMFSEAVALARRLDDLVTLGDVLARAGSMASPSAELRAQLAELTDVAARLADPVLAYWGEIWSGLSALGVGDGQGHEQHLRATAERAAELGQPFHQWLSGIVGSSRAAVAGRLTEAEAIAEEALRMGQSAGLPDAFRTYGANLYWVRHAQGRLDEQLDLLARAAARDEASAITRSAYALALCELDRPAEARPVLEAVAAQEFQQFVTNYSWLYGLCLAADVCAAVGDVENAEVLVAILSPHRGLVGTIGGGACPSVDHHLGLLTTTLARHDEADTHFTEAARIHEQLGAPIWLARTRLEWARLLLTRRAQGDGDRARQLLGQALAIATELGLGTIERRGRALLGEAT